MATSSTSLLGLALPVTGELSGTWGDTVNNSITNLLDSAIAGTTTITTDADITLSTTALSTNESRQAIIKWATTSGTTTRYITAPAQSKVYVVINAAVGAQSIVFRGVGPTTGVTITQGSKRILAWNGSDFVEVGGSGSAGTVTSVGWTGGVVSVATPTTTPAFTVAGTSGGVPYFSSATAWASSNALTQYGIVYGGGAGGAPASTAAGTTGQVLLAQTGSAPIWGTTGGGGTVTTVGWTGGIVSVANNTTTPAFTIAGTSGGVPYFNSGTTWATSAALTQYGVMYGGGAGGAPVATAVGTTGQYLQSNTGAAPSWGQVSLTAGVTGVLPVANGGTNASAAGIAAFNNITGYTASGATGTTSTNLVFSTSPSITTPTILTNMVAPVIYGGTGTASSLQLISTSGVGSGDAIQMKVGTNGAITALSVATGGIVTISTLALTNALGVPSGGTGLSTLAAGSIAYGNGTSAYNTLPINATANTILNSSGTAPQYSTLTTLLDTLGSTQGQVLYRGASTWTALATGTSGQVLTTGGSAANPSWSTPSIGVNAALTGTLETSTINATALAATYNFDVKTQSAMLVTANAANNWVLNVRGDGSTTLTSILGVGQSITIALLSTQGTTAYYQTGLQVDSTSQTIKWINGAAPTAGNVSGVDSYTFTIIKTASAPTYTVFGSVSKFA